MSLRLCVVLIAVLLHPISAESQVSKFKLVASTLVYNTFASPNEQEQEITWEDVDELEALLKSEPSALSILLFERHPLDLESLS